MELRKMEENLNFCLNKLKNKIEKIGCLEGHVV